uniref:G_PROTEIN_RECEP_F1_2 domain-containing protein n=1 Tax=Globodera pallida TaxID=36090 RepID=A0A183BZI0_GLOPA
MSRDGQKVPTPLLLMSANADRNSPPSGQPIVLKCVFDTNSSLFMMYIFCVGYLVPAFLITFFYVRVILKLRADAISVRKHSDGQNWALSSARFHKVFKRILAVILFYFFCWTPYWTLNIMSHFGIIIVSWSTLTLSSVFFAAHLLVCFNSAANPVLYALINRELRQQNAQAFQKRRRSLHLATNNALGFIEKQFPSTPTRKEQRGASVGYSDDSHQRLLNFLGLMRGPRSADCDRMLEKRSCSFSNSAPALFPFYGTNKKGWHFGSSNFLHPFAGGPKQNSTNPWKDERDEEEEVGSVVTASAGDAFL